MRRCWPLAAALAACAPRVEHVEHALAEGDAVIAVTGARELDDARVSITFAGADGVARVDVDDGEATAITVLESAKLVDAAGGTRSLLSIAADLRGDVEGACGCSIPPLGDTQIVSPGDRCGIPAARPVWLVGDSPDDPAVIEAVRSRLRVEWPGECACRPKPLAERASLTVCPLGEDAERFSPTHLAVGGDGTVTMVGRTRAIQIGRSGARYETPIDPPLHEVFGVAALPGGGAFILAESQGGPDTEHLYLPPRGEGPVTTIAGFDGNRRLRGLHRAPRSGEVWLFGGMRNELPALLRCRFGARPRAEDCDVVRPVEVEGCPQHRFEQPIHGVTEVENGDVAVMLRAGGQIFVRDGRAVCLPGTDRIRAPSVEGVDLLAFEAGTLTSIGDRLVACLVAESGSQRQSMILTADLPAPAGLEWRAVQQQRGDAAFCPPTAYTDPIAGRAVVAAFVAGSPDMSEGPQPMDYVAITATSAQIVRDTSDTHYYPELDVRFFIAASSSRAVALTTARGETWLRTDDAPSLRRITRLRGDVNPQARAIVAEDGGFAIYGGGSEPARVRISGESGGCEGVTLERRVEALPAEATDSDHAATRLGDRTLVFGRRDGAIVMLVHDGGAVARVPLGGGSIVARAAEIGPRAAFVRADGSLWSTDGRTAEVIDAMGVWRWLDADGRVGWVASDAELARLVPDGEGGLTLERRVTAAMDTSAFDAVERAEPARISAVRALCGGRALVTYRERLSPRRPELILTASAWTIAPVAGRLTFAAYPGFDQSAEAPLSTQDARYIGGDDAAPILVFHGNTPADGLHARGVRAAALPFAGSSGIGRLGADTLVGGPGFRMALVRARPSD